MTYRAPVADMVFTLEEVAGLNELPDFEPGLARAVLGEAAKLADSVIAPLDEVGDQEGCRLEEGAVITAQGFREAYVRYCEGGWGAVAGAPAYSGQGLPFALALATQEMWNAACMSFALAPMLTHGAVDALEAHGTEAQKSLCLAKLTEGTWTATMNLTEPQAGSDVGALRTKALPAEAPDGAYDFGAPVYRLQGTKIFITFGEHDMAENIIHLVLARLPDAPKGTRGVSLFLVPKYIPDAEGAPGTRNGVWCTGLEKKLGIHASPTCVMTYGEKDDALGWLIGAPHGGMAAMFTMMNAARLHVGIQGVAIGARASGRAHAFARERRQGRAAGVRDAPAPIIAHPDVRRQLATMDAMTEAGRALCYANAVALDKARTAKDDTARKAAQARGDLLIPISKSWCTDAGVESASLGIQVHGGMGFIEETGAARHWRDSRIAPIYEGTNGIQANDLVGRKLQGDGGAAMQAFIAEMREEAATHAQSNDSEANTIARRLEDALNALTRATDFMLTQAKDRPEDTLAGASAYLRLAGTVAGGFYLARAHRIAAEHERNANGSSAFYARHKTLARFYAQTILPSATGFEQAACAGADSLPATTP